MNGAIDIGSSRIKVWCGGPDLIVAGPTPDDPEGIREAVVEARHQYFNANARVAISCFRRAIVIDEGERLRLSWAREGLQLNIDELGDLDPMSPAARWTAWPQSRLVDGLLSTFEGWLAHQLTGGHVVTATAAALTGLWDVGTGEWIKDRIAKLDLRADLLPEVARAPLVLDGWVLPVMADHQATAAAAVRLPDCIGIIEFGTAMALVALPSDHRAEWELANGVPGEAMTELIDALHYRRRAGDQVPGPGWFPTDGEPTVSAVALEGLRQLGLHNRRDGWIAVSGGGSTTQLLAELSTAVETELRPTPTAVPVVGAALVAEGLHADPGSAPS